MLIEFIVSKPPFFFGPCWLFLFFTEIDKKQIVQVSTRKWHFNTYVVSAQKHKHGKNNGNFYWNWTIILSIFQCMTLVCFIIIMIYFWLLMNLIENEGQHSVHSLWLVLFYISKVFLFRVYFTNSLQFTTVFFVDFIAFVEWLLSMKWIHLSLWGKSLC